MQRHPVRAAFGQQRARAAVAGIHQQQIQLLLVAAVALGSQPAAVGQPLHARQIGVAVAQVGLHCGSWRGHGGDKQLHRSIGRAGIGVALRHHLDVGGVYFETLRLGYG